MPHSEFSIHPGPNRELFGDGGIVVCNEEGSLPKYSKDIDEEFKNGNRGKPLLNLVSLLSKFLVDSSGLIKI